MCGHRQDAEETMQEVLFRSLTHLSNLEDPNALAAWLYTVTRNRCHRMRRGPFERNERRLSLNELMPGEEELTNTLLDSERGQDSAIHGEQQHLFHQAVLLIPTPLRMVMVLDDMEELSSEQIAKILDLQMGTVRVRLHRAKAAGQERDGKSPQRHTGAGRPREINDYRAAS
jgi:RNA polymerase sigma-70 factor, ECF subfamily